MIEEPVTAEEEDAIVIKELETAEEVKDAIRENQSFLLHTSLTILDLGNNNIGDNGAKLIADTLENNFTLTTLNLEGNNIGEIGASQIGNSLSLNTTLKTLNLSNNNAGDKGTLDISYSLRNNTTLQSLNLNNNNIVVLPSEFGKIQFLDLGDNKISNIPPSISKFLNQLNLKGNPLKQQFKKYDKKPFDKDLLLLLQDSTDSIKQPQKLKLIFLGDGGVGKTSLLYAFNRNSQNFLFRPSLESTITTAAIDIHPFESIAMDDGVHYQVWDFAGQIQYGTIHQHFLSFSESIYIVVVSLLRNIESQIDYWMSFLKFQLDFTQQSFCIIFVGSKSDLVKDKNELKRKTSLLQNHIKKYEEEFLKHCATQPIVTPPLIYSSKDLSNISKLKSIVSKQARKVLGAAAQHFPKTYLDLYNFIHQSKPLVIEQTHHFPTHVYRFLHNVGDIIYYSVEEDKGIVCTKPETLAKIMAIFICPDEHEISLLSYMEKLKRPRRSIMQQNTVRQRIRGFLTHHHHQSNDTIINGLLIFMEEMHFLIRLKEEESEIHYQKDAILFPSLRPVGEFRWNFIKDIEKMKVIKTLGRRIINTKIHIILPFWFCKIQISLLKQFRDSEPKSFPCLYSNGLLLKGSNDSELLLMVETSMKHLDVIIRGPSPYDLWSIIKNWVFEDVDLDILYLDPLDIFSNTSTFPLVLEKIPAIDQKTFETLDTTAQKGILEGALGDIPSNASYPWNFMDGIVVDKPYNDSDNLFTLTIEPPKNGIWTNPLHQREFELVSKAFEYFIGVDAIKNFKLEKIELLHNKKILQNFIAQYNLKRDTKNQPKWQDNENKETVEHQESVINHLLDYVNNVSGDEQTNLIMCWHGGCMEPYGVAEHNFDEPHRNDPSRLDQGYFGNGIYFTKYVSYGNKYMEIKKNQMKEGTPLILSWVIMGNPYPVVEKDVLRGKPCMAGYNSHYVLVKKRTDDETLLDYYPCLPKEQPDYDEIVIFNPDQILPRYLIYYSKIETTTPKRTVLWVDSNPSANKKLISNIEGAGNSVLIFTTSREFKLWLVRRSGQRMNVNSLCVVSNSNRPGDGDETAGVRLCHWFKDDGSEWKNVPFMIYCQTEQVYDLPIYKGVYMTKEENEILKFVAKAKPYVH